LRRSSIFTLVFYALVGATAINVVYHLINVLKTISNDVQKNLAIANFYRINALALYVNKTGKAIETDLGDCTIHGKTNSLLVYCGNFYYQGKTPIKIVGIGKGHIKIIPKEDYLLISK